MIAKSLSAELERLHEPFWTGIPNEMHKHIVGADEFIKMLVLTLLSGSGHRQDEGGKEYHAHILTEGGVGLGKTEIAKTFTATLGEATFQRIQCEPDLKPASLKVIVRERGDGTFEFTPGPLNAHVVLVEELTRAGDSVHTALIEAMAEGLVSHPSLSYRTPRPCLLIATANPRDVRGVVGRLGTAISDRFTFRIDPPHYTPQERKEIVLGQEERAKQTVHAAVSVEDVLTARDHIFEDIHIDPHITDSIERITSLAHTRFVDESDFSKHGAEGERPGLWFVRTSKAFAFHQKRPYVLPEDVETVAYWILRHRIDLGFSVRNQKEVKREAIGDIVSEVLRETA